jgi:alpha-1,6-mannosyltransferase
MSNAIHLQTTWFRGISLFTGFSVVLVYLTYFIDRNESFFLIASYSLLFVFYLTVIFNVKENEVSFWLIASILLRCFVWLSIPNLSDDFYRFVWDGRLLREGLHPFAQVPSFYMLPGNEVSGLSHDLFNKLNSKEYFTIYPPIAQLIFWISTIISPKSVTGSVLVMRSFILLAEVGTIFMLKKFVEEKIVAAKHILIYALNPLVIIELTGNLHFEGFLIFFLLLSVYLIHQNKIIQSAMSLACAVSVKLIPLIFLPSLLNRLDWRQWIKYCFVVALGVLVAFTPLYDQTIAKGLSTSIGYYFKKFEFNASVYYLVREWGFWKYGYNIIQTTGWKLGAISFLLIMLVSLYKPVSGYLRDRLAYIHPQSLTFLMTIFQWVLVIYILFSTIVHPWYITPLVLFSVFTNDRFSILWSYLIFLTYIGYTRQGFSENLYVTAIEYVLVFAYAAYELRGFYQQKKYQLS